MNASSSSPSAGSDSARIAAQLLSLALAPVLEERPGDRVGSFILLERLGEGGFGTVWLAEQREPVRRKAALKIIKAGLDSDEVISRFELERNVLALLNHPNIAHVLEAGTDPGGRPYFAMDLVAGLPCTRFCDEQRFPVAARLELFVTICRAVEHAHQKGVIHRDLKPANILVAWEDGVMRPRLIDFGIAKVTRESGIAAQATRRHAFVGTPAYISPEQVDGAAVDTRSDLYSLGAVLHELLVGEPPVDAATLDEADWPELRRLLCETDPPRPSRRFAGLPSADRETMAANRATTAPQLARSLAGDLDCIVGRCMEKDPARRYPSADALAEDIARYLTDEPVTARPPSRWYVLRKFVRRHRVACGAGALIASALVAGLAGTTTFWLAERRATARAELARRQADTLMNLLLRELQPWVEQFSHLPLQDRFAAETVKYYESLPPGSRDASYAGNRAIALSVLACVRFRHSSADQALTAANEAMIWRQKVLDHDPAEFRRIARLLRDPQIYFDVGDQQVLSTFEVERNVARLRGMVREGGDSFLMKELALELRTLAFRRAEPDTPLVASRPLLEEARGLVEAAVAHENGETSVLLSYGVIMLDLAFHYHLAGEYEAGDAIAATAVAAKRSAYERTPGNLLLLDSLCYDELRQAELLATTDLAAGAAAEARAREHYALIQRLDPDAPSAREMEVFCSLIQGWYELQDGQLAAARRTFGMIDERYQEHPPGINPDLTGWVAVDLAKVAGAVGDREEARRQMGVAHQRLATSLGPRDAPATWIRLNSLIAMCHAAEAAADWSSLEGFAAAGVTTAEALLRAGPQQGQLRNERGYLQRFLGIALIRQRREAEAVPILEESASLLAAGLPPWHPFGSRELWLAEAREALGQALIATGRPAEAGTVLAAALAWRTHDLERQPDLAAARAGFANAARLWFATDCPARPVSPARRLELGRRAREVLGSDEVRQRLSVDQRRQLAEFLSVENP